jgi:hypothetical protein
MATNQQIAQEIASHVAACGGAYPGWYIGIAADPQQRLFGDHGVHRVNDSWITRPCASSNDARVIEQYFLGLGMKGGPGGGDHSTSHIYAYAITQTTRE